MEQLILENKNLIYSITKYFEKYGNKEDLFQAGCIGMILAHRNFDPTMNVKFTTYAYPYILGEMRKLVREDKSLKISRNIQMLNYKIEKAYIHLTQTLMREPSYQLLADYLEIPVYLVNEAINSTNVVASIDEPIMLGGREVTLHDTIGNIEKMNKDDLLSLKQAVNELKNDDKKLIYKRYMEDLTQQEVANQFGMSQVQTSRSEKKVLIKLREKIIA